MDRKLEHLAGTRAPENLPALAAKQNEFASRQILEIGRGLVMNLSVRTRMYYQNSSIRHLCATACIRLAEIGKSHTAQRSGWVRKLLGVRLHGSV